MVDLHGAERIAPMPEMNGLARVRVVERTGLHFAAAGTLVPHVRQIMGQHIFTYVATIAIRVRLTIAERGAIITGLAGVIVDRKPFQRFRSGAGRRIFTGDLADGRTGFRQNQADGDADHRGDHL